MQRRGADFQVRINGVLYGVQSLGVSAHVQDIVTSNTEGICGNPDAPRTLFTTTRIADLGDGEFTLGFATFDDTDNPFAAPLNFELGAYYAIEAFPIGVDGGISYDWGNCLSTAFSHSARVPGPQPLNLTFKPDGVDVLEMVGL